MSVIEIREKLSWSPPPPPLTTCLHPAVLKHPLPITSPYDLHSPATAAQGSTNLSCTLPASIRNTRGRVVECIFNRNKNLHSSCRLETKEGSAVSTSGNGGWREGWERKSSCYCHTRNATVFLCCSQDDTHTYFTFRITVPLQTNRNMLHNYSPSHSFLKKK